MTHATMRGKAEALRFIPECRPRRLTDDEIMNGLRRFARGRKRLSSVAFERWRDRPCSVGTLLTRFGGWGLALKLAALPHGVRPTRSPDELMDILEKTWLSLGRAPSRDALRKHGGVSDVAYRRLWGSLLQARRRLAEYKAGRITREELLKPLARRRYRKRVRKGERAELRPSVRLAVITRDGQKCVICGQGTKQGAVLEIDHITPVCRGGSNEMENLRTLCFACNRGKGKK